MYNANYPSEDISRFIAEELQRIEIGVNPERQILVGGTNAPAFENSWANILSSGDPISPLRFYIDAFERVFIEGNIDSGTSGTTIFTLPIGYRPTYKGIWNIESSTTSGGHGGHSHVTVNTDGTVVAVFSGTPVTDFWLNGVTFRL